MTPEIEQQIDLAHRARESGDLETAGLLYRQLLIHPETRAVAAEALGQMAFEQNRLDDAIGWLSEAADLRPDAAHRHANLGMVLAIAGRHAEGIEAYRRAVAVGADCVDAHNQLGDLLLGQNRFEEAIGEYRHALGIRPEMPETLVNLGNALHQLGRSGEAVDAYRAAVKYRPDFAEAFNNMGIALAAAGRLGEAVEAYRRAISVRPEYPEALNHLGIALHQLGDVGSIDFFVRALDLKPDLVDARLNLVQALRDAGRLDDAIVACMKGADHPQVASGYLYTLLMHPEIDQQRIDLEHQRWNERFGKPVAGGIVPHGNDASPERRIRVGYVARNLGNHPLGRFMAPLLEDRDRNQFEVFVYCDVTGADRVGSGLRASADCWRTTLGMSDEQVAGLIREDRIDIAVDLMMHVGNNRLMVFAQKPAPVLVSYLAYPGSSGLETIDYRLTDQYLEPVDVPEPSYAREKPVRLAGGFWGYTEPTEAPAVGGLPALREGRVTFGCLNMFSKVNARVLAAWSRILLRVPQSRLILHCFKGSQRESAVQAFGGHGISSDRLGFVEHLPLEGYFAEYNRIDIALDPFPYPGGTTTCDALWMGVPVVTLAGNSPLSRGGVSILSNVGCPELIAHSLDQYVSNAVALASDREGLGAMRTLLREKMRRSALMDTRRFVGDVEDVYRGMWAEWCGRRGGNGQLTVDN